MQPSVLSSADRQRLEALIRSPQTFVPHAIVDETLKRATQVLEQSRANEQALRVAAQAREAAVREVLDSAAQDTDAQTELKRKQVHELIRVLIPQIEAALAQAAKA